MSLDKLVVMKYLFSYAESLPCVNIAIMYRRKTMCWLSGSNV